MKRSEILTWLRQADHSRLAVLWDRADRVRREIVGDQVHLRGLIEISNHCRRSCAYCGIGGAAAPGPARYRMTAEEIVACARQGAAAGFGTVVLQSGEDPCITRDWLADVIAGIKAETPLAITLSLGERRREELAAWRAAGADRYLLRFETGNTELYGQLHPRADGSPGRPADRIALLGFLRSVGYEIGSGVLVGLPGQTWASLARDVEMFAELDLDMIGLGPYVPDPATALGRGDMLSATPGREQVTADDLTACKVLALTRLLCPRANIPSTTALTVVNPRDGRRLGLERGANVFMPNLTPARYRRLYSIYPGKADFRETAEALGRNLPAFLGGIGRRSGRGPGNARREPRAISPAGRGHRG